MHLNFANFAVPTSRDVLLRIVPEKLVASHLRGAKVMLCSLMIFFGTFASDPLAERTQVTPHTYVLMDQ